MSESAKKAKKKAKAKKINLLDFQKQGSSQIKSSLPSAPGELPSGPGQGGGRYGRGDRRRGGYDRPQSAADSSNQWRNNNRTPSDRGSRRGYDRDYSNRGSSGGSFGGRRERERDQPSKYDDSVSRSMFGSKKQGPTRIETPSRSSFGSGSGRPSRSNRMDDDRGFDRSSFGTRKATGTPLRTGLRSGFGGRRGGDFEPSSGGFGSSRTPLQRRPFDGSGNGFAAHLVADLFNNDSTGPDRRTNYSFGGTPKKTSASRFARDLEPAPVQRNPDAPWGNKTSTPARNQKTPEEIEAEEAEKAAREQAARAERQAREEKQRKEREKKRQEAKRKAEEKAAQEAEKERVASLHEDIKSMFESGGVAKELTKDHLEIVIPTLEPEDDEQAEKLGTALAMTVNQGTISMKEAMHIIPEKAFDITFLSMLKALNTRMGEMKFISEIQNQEIDIFEILQDQTNIEERLKEANLGCLISDNETESKLEEGFAKHVSLKELYDLVASFEEFPLELIPRLNMYIFDEFFKNQDDPDSWFSSGTIFEFIGEKLNGHTEIIDSAIKSWHENGADETKLIPMFHRLLSADYIFPDQIVVWSTDYENHDAKMAALFADIDDYRTFNDWIMSVEEEYYVEEEDDEDDDMQFGGLL